MLDLGHNVISVIPETNTIWPKQLNSLYLFYNQLRNIPPLPQNASVNLISNPIFCGCDLSLNKKNSETLIKVDCHELDLLRKPVQIKKEVAKYDKYRANVNTCKPVKILKFSYLETKGQFVLTCLTSSGYPSAVLFIYHGNQIINRSKVHAKMEVEKPGLYICRVTNYISSHQKKLHIAYTTLDSSESSVTLITELPENHESKTAYEELCSTISAKHGGENIQNIQGK